MPLRYNGTTIGTFTLVQKREDEEKPRKYKIQIRQGNCLAVFLHIYKEKEPEDPSRPWVHQLVSFFEDERHIKNCKRDFDDGYLFKGLFCGDLKDIKLNLYYKECNTLLKYFVKDGLKVSCFYKEEKKK